MPYDERADLPNSVQDNLPAHAQDISKEAYNSAWDEYGHHEPGAHRVAWGAVENNYTKMNPASGSKEARTTREKPARSGVRALKTLTVREHGTRLKIGAIAPA